jgi:uncharacterized protein
MIMRFCPVCKVPLKKTLRNEVSIDTCPSCRGVWLDLNELDMILQRSNMEFKSNTIKEESVSKVPETELHHKVPVYPPKQNKDQSYLEELFDFDD